MRKLTKKWQLFLYAMGGMGVNMLNLMMGSYLCSALISDGFGDDLQVITNQTFMGVNLVVPAVWAVFGVIAKIIDGIIDVPMASFSDNLRTRWGRRRPTLVIGLAVMIAAYLLFLVVPKPVESMLNTVYYGVVLCVFYSFYTLTMVTYYATFTEIVETEKERSLISNVKSVCDIVYFILGYVGVVMLLGGMNIRKVALIVLPIVLTMLIPLFMIKEKSTLRADTEGEVGDTIQKTETVNLAKSLACTFRNKSFMIWMCVYAFMTFGVQLFLSGINEYFARVGMNMIYVMLAAFAPVPFTLLIYNRIKAKYGFGAAYRYTLVCYVIGMTVMFAVGFMNDGTLKTVLAIMAGLFSSLAVGSMFAVAYSVPSQLAAEEEEKTGVSNSAMYFAVQGLFSGVASGIGGSAVLTLLKTTDTVPYMTAISALGILVALYLTLGLPKSILNMGKNQKESDKVDEHKAD